MHLLCDGSNLPGLRMISSRAWQGESVRVRGGTRLQPLPTCRRWQGYYKLLVGLDAWASRRPCRHGQATQNHWRHRVAAASPLDDCLVMHLHGRVGRLSSTNGNGRSAFSTATTADSLSCPAWPSHPKVVTHKAAAARVAGGCTIAHVHCMHG